MRSDRPAVGARFDHQSNNQSRNENVPQPVVEETANMEPAKLSLSNRPGVTGRQRCGHESPSEPTGSAHEEVAEVRRAESRIGLSPLRPVWSPAEGTTVSSGVD